MTRKSTYLFFYLLLTCTVLMAQVIYLHTYTHKVHLQELWVRLVGLPDLAMVSEAHYIRHRSLSGVSAFFNDSPELLEYFPSTFVYHYAPSATQTSLRIERAQ